MKNKSSYVLTKLIGFTTTIHIAGALLSGILAYTVIREAVFELSEQNLAAILNSRAVLVEEYFRSNREQVASLSQNETIVDATLAFSKGFASLEDDLKAKFPDQNAVLEELNNAYINEFRSSDLQHDGTMALVPKTATARLAQLVYIARNANSYEQKNALRVSPYDSQFEEAHRKFHPPIYKLLKAFEYRDIFLIDTHGNLIYSTQKEIDFATNLNNGTFANTGLGYAFQRSIASERNTVTMTDFELYLPSLHEPAAFFAVPIFENNKRIGVVAFQLSSEKLNRVISDPHGLGSTGETYVVGDDLLMRTDSRFLEHSTILNRVVDTGSSKAIFRNQSGSGIIRDYRNVEVLSHYRPLDIAGLNWGIIAEIDQAEILEPAFRIPWLAIGVLLIALCCVAGTSVFVLRVCIKRPLDQLVSGSHKIVEGDYSTRVHITSNDEFAVLANSQNEMAVAVQEHIIQLESALAEVKELQGLLPICSSCKSVRDDDGYYKTIETYLVGKSKIEFSHTICTDCIPRLYPDISEQILSKLQEPSSKQT